MMICPFSSTHDGYQRGHTAIRLEINVQYCDAGADKMPYSARHLDDHTVISVLAIKPTLNCKRPRLGMLAGSDIFADIRPAKEGCSGNY
jgi:hypothetical protein